MILGIGVDIVDVGRVERLLNKFPDRFVRRVFSSREIQYSLSRKSPAKHLAARFAAKESVLKALGLGMGKGVGLKDVEVARDETGKIDIVLKARANEIASSMGIKKCFISISHEKELAVAMAVLEG